MRRGMYCIFFMLFLTTNALAGYNFCNESSQPTIEELDSIYSELLSSYSDSIITDKILLFTAQNTIIDLPYEIYGISFYDSLDVADSNSYLLNYIIEEIYLNNDSIIDSSNGYFYTYINQMEIDSLLLNKLIKTNTKSIYRRTRLNSSYTPFELTTSENDLSLDHSIYYRMSFTDSVDFRAKMDTIYNIEDISDVTFGSNVILDAGSPPDTTNPPPDYCNCLQPQLLYLQYQLHSKDSTGYGKTGMVDAWRWDCDLFTETNDSVKIGIVDVGFGAESEYHPDLNVDDLSRVEFTFLDTFDIHGTAVAGVAVTKHYVGYDQGGDDSTGTGCISDNLIIGSSPQCQAVLVDITRSYPPNDSYDYIDGLKYLIDSTSVKVINLSWHIPTNDDKALVNLLNEAYFKKDIAIVAAAGNKTSQQAIPFTYLPGSLPYVMTVGNCDSSGFWYYKSNYGNPTDCMAPGCNIITTGYSNHTESDYDLTNSITLSGSIGEPLPLTRYIKATGTSVSAPQITSLIANILSVNPDLCAATAIDLVKESCTLNPYDTASSSKTGLGVPDAEEAILNAMNYPSFYQDFVGDINGDHRINDGDISQLLKFLANSEPMSYPAMADVDGNCIVDNSDLDYLIDYLYDNGPAPADDTCNHVILGTYKIDENENVLEIDQNYPNPFNPTTTISYNLPEKSDVKLEIYNILGQKVAILVNESQEAGEHFVEWDGSKLASGIYLYRLVTAKKEITKKMTLIK